MPTPLEKRLPLALLILRLSVVLVFLVWISDKFFNPSHATAVFKAFYGLGGLGTAIIYGVGLIQLVIVLLFLAGLVKPWSYGLVLGMHAASTLSSFRQYLDPLAVPNILFFAAWPMLAACFVLFYLRDYDVLLTLDRGQPRP